MSFDPPQLALPVLREHAAPFVDRPQCFGVGARHRAFALPPRGHKSRVAQHDEVFRDGGLRQLQRVDDFADNNRSASARDAFFISAIPTQLATEYPIRYT